ncbi:DUF4233 domain-containing protein [Tropheryma whipplei]|uniref:DUF4233 domain-containing protein n=1 Tax=Tropheryma whipplei TaxID=2039 RepID=UPI000000C7FF|nr:DUF4233 domain-containing protein [Tropheryma whipplei]CAD66963.1 putative membrane protein [Tropheryma whipplei TW08/27]
MNYLRTKVARVVLSFELVAFILAGVFLFTMPFDRFPSGIFIAVVVPMAFLALLLSSKLFGITLGWIVQIFIVTVGFFISIPIAIFGFIFGTLWAYALWSARHHNGHMRQ